MDWFVVELISLKKVGDRNIVSKAEFVLQERYM